jgi:hypothetical protein
MQQQPMEQQYDEDNQSNVDNIADEIVESVDDDVAKGTIPTVANEKKSSEGSGAGGQVSPVVGSIVGGKNIFDTSFKDGNQVVDKSFEGVMRLSISPLKVVMRLVTTLNRSPQLDNRPIMPKNRFLTQPEQQPIGQQPII